MDLCYIDTCLSCYVLDHCNGDNELLLGVTVNRASRVFEVKNLLHEEVRSLDVDKPGFDYDAAHAAIDAAFKGAHPLKAWSKTLEPSDPDDDTGESVYSWFRLTWEPAEDAAEGWDNVQALAEGWDLFWTDRDHASGLELQRVDDPMSLPELGYDDPKFASDEDARAFVVQRAAEGSDYHARALDRLSAKAIAPQAEGR